MGGCIAVRAFYAGITFNWLQHEEANWGVRQL